MSAFFIQDYSCSQQDQLLSLYVQGHSRTKIYSCNSHLSPLLTLCCNNDCTFSPNPCPKDGPLLWNCECGEFRIVSSSLINDRLFPFSTYLRTFIFNPRNPTMWTSLVCECGALMAGKCLSLLFSLKADCACLLGMAISGDHVVAIDGDLCKSDNYEDDDCDYFQFCRSKYYRQSLMFSSFVTPEMNSLFNKHFCNILYTL